MTASNRLGIDFDKEARTVGGVTDVGAVKDRPVDNLGGLTQGVPLPGGIGSVSPTLDVRQWHKKGLLRDEGAVFAQTGQSGGETVVLALRGAVRLKYALDAEQVNQDVSLAWTDDRPSFVCSCGRLATKLSFDGRRFVCRRCYSAFVNPFAPKKKTRKRIPVKTRLRVLARDGFQCTGCGGVEGGLTVKRAFKCDECVRNNPVYDGNLYTVCASCSEGLRRGFGGVMALARKLQRLGQLNLLHHRDGLSPSPSLSRDTQFSAVQVEEMQRVPEPDTNLGQRKTISVHEERKERRFLRQERTNRIILKLLVGVETNRVAAEERVSRQTVWRHRRRVRRLAPVVRQMMYEAARRKDWQQARFWRRCLMNIGAELNGDNEPRVTDMKEWRKRLSAFRDERRRRAPPASRNEDEGRPDRAALLRGLEGLSEPKLDEWMQEASRKEIDFIDDLRRAAWRAKREAEDDPAEVGRAHFLWALYDPVVLNARRLAVKQWLKEQRAG